MHELGHFIVARLCKVRVNEFALGMGPAIFKRKVGETTYALRALPVGGFCAMEGEDEDSDDPAAFGSKPIWQRCLILIAGAAMNFIMGLIILLIIYAPVEAHTEATISSFSEGYPYASGQYLAENEDGNINALLPGDTIKKIDGERIYVYSDVGLFLGRGSGGKYDFVVERDGRNIELKGVALERRTYPTEALDENGNIVVVDQQRFGIEFTRVKSSLGDRVKLALLEAVDFVRLIRVSLFDLFTGGASVSEMSGPIGIGTMITTTAQTSFTSMWLLVALIAINLAVMNMLPLPALDGGRVLFLIIEKIRGKPLQAKYEGFIHAAGLVLLLSLMVYVSFNDIVRIVTG